MQDFHQFVWDDNLKRDCRTLVKLALAEDLGGEQDWTTIALVPADRMGAANIVAREPGIAAGLLAIPVVLAEAQSRLHVTTFLDDGQHFAAGTKLAEITGNVRDLLTVERTLLNLLGRLLGIATLTGRYVSEVAGTGARIYDTRKTMPGWRRLEKYAVRCGGGSNHRTGLFDAVLIKDNHLAQRSGAAVGSPADAASAVQAARQFLQSPQGAAKQQMLPVEVEVDSLDQLAAVLPAGPDIVLLDNMPPALLREAVKLRDQVAPHVELEASGGVRLETLREIAATGVERISVGALTHSARVLDIGLDWQG
ncbi:MAG: carboxylating nicotinate-nucleotide diphosphorylase [Bythopirellula sp.]|nr:carboxylating nicotinate-nucleotide diphosphorylase [Bythopirellula sp.]